MMRKQATVLSFACLLTACQGDGTADGPKAWTLRDDLGGRLFFVESDGRQGGKRTVLVLSCHGDGDNGIMFKTGVTPVSAPPDGVVLDYAAGAVKGRAEANWTSGDVWSFRDSKMSGRAAKLFLEAPAMTVRFPVQMGMAHSATWRHATAAAMNDQLHGWCVKPAG